MKHLLKLLLKLLFLIPIFFLIIYLKIFSIKLIFLRSSRLGDFMITTEYFLRKNQNFKNYILIINKFSCANKFITSEYQSQIEKRKYITFSNNTLVRVLYWFKNLFIIFKLEKEMLTYNDFNSKYNYKYSYTYPIFSKTKPTIDLSKFKKDFLKLSEKLNLDKDKIVCLHVRDSFYLKKKFPNENWNYHDFRNVNINEYIDVINYLNSKGFNVIKLGENEQKINNSKLILNEKFINFSESKFYSSKNEILLSFFCNFMIGTYSGISHTQQILNKPMIFLNTTPFIEKPYGMNNLFIPKKLLNLSNNKLISVKDSLMNGYFKIYNGNELNIHNLKYINNNKLEMIAAIEEFMKTYRKKNFTASKNQVLFNKIFENYNINLGNKNFICDSFLKKNQYLIS